MLLVKLLRPNLGRTHTIPFARTKSLAQHMAGSLSTCQKHDPFGTRFPTPLHLLTLSRGILVRDYWEEMHAVAASCEQSVIGQLRFVLFGGFARHCYTKSTTQSNTTAESHARCELHQLEASKFGQDPTAGAGCPAADSALPRTFFSFLIHGVSCKSCRNSQACAGTAREICVYIYTHLIIM